MLLVVVPKLTLKLCTLVEGCCKSHRLILFELLCRNDSGVHGLQFIIQSTVKVIGYFFSNYCDFKTACVSPLSLFFNTTIY
jgi:hypothetical protein